jgi:hypothetical protein
MPWPVTNKLTRTRRSSPSEDGRRQLSLSSHRTQTWSFSHDPQHELQHDDDQPQSRPPTMAESVFSPEPTTTPATSTMLQQLAIQEWALEQSSALDQSTMSLPSSIQMPAPAPAPSSASVAAAASTSIWRVSPPFLLGVENFDSWMDSITLIAKCNGWDEHLKSRHYNEGADPSIQAAVNLLLYTTVSSEIAQDLKAKGWTRKLTPMQTLVMITSVLTEEKDGEDELPVKQAIKRLDPCNFPSLFASSADCGFCCTGTRGTGTPSGRLSWPRSRLRTRRGMTSGRKCGGGTGLLSGRNLSSFC